MNLLFADDDVVFALDAASVQSILNDIEQYCHKWNMADRPSMTYSSIIRNWKLWSLLNTWNCIFLKMENGIVTRQIA